MIKYDQHFLKDSCSLSKVVGNLKISEDDIILEVGCGTGNLTQFLTKLPAKVVGVEIDRDLYNFLKGKYPKIRFVNSDILKCILDVDFNVCISSIPYSITETLYEKILEKKPKFCLFIQGKNFYNKCSLKSYKSKWYYLLNSFYSLKKIQELPKDSFSPKTRTTSVITMLTFKKREEISIRQLIIRELFKRRNRFTHNALLYSLVEVFKFPKKFVRENYLYNFKFKDKALKNLSNKEFLQLVLYLGKLEFRDDLTWIQ